MNFAGILGNAIRGGAAVVGQQAQGYIEDQRKVDVAQQLSQMEEEKAMRLAEAQADLQRKNDLIMNDPTGQHQTFRQTNLKTELQTRGDSAVDVAGREAQARTKVEQDAVRAYATDPTLTQGVRKKALAAHITGPQEELARLQLTQAKQVADLRTRLSATTDPTEREALQAKIADLSGASRSDKDMIAAFSTLTRSKQDALKIVNDPMATQEAKDAAQGALADLDLAIQFTKGKLPGFGTSPKPAVAPKFDTPTPESISKLKSNPALKSAFDARFGPGAADKILGGK